MRLQRIFAVFLMVSFVLCGEGMARKKTVQPASAGSSFCKFTMAVWNIGHFALGKKDDTTISQADAPQKMMDYRTFLNTVNADMLAVAEYSPHFAYADAGKPDIMARDAVFSSYSDARLGSVYSYNCNSLFSNGFNILSTEEVMFSKMVQKRYYQHTKVLMGCDTVHVVSTHLDWNQGEKGKEYRKVQMNDLISRFQKEKYVILCADWNADAVEYDLFRDAGYSMANHGVLGDIPTAPAGEKANVPIDNIIVKGFSVNGVKVYNEPLLSDHCLVSATLIKL